MLLLLIGCNSSKTIYINFFFTKNHTLFNINKNKKKKKKIIEKKKKKKKKKNVYRHKICILIIGIKSLIIGIKRNKIIIYLNFFWST